LHNCQGNAIPAIALSPPSGGDKYSPDAGCVWGVFIVV
jgi:hypothetical protein